MGAKLERLSRCMLCWWCLGWGVAINDFTLLAWEAAKSAADAALFNARPFHALAERPDLAAAALVIPFLAGVSELAGQAYVLSRRRIKPPRAFASLLLTGLVHVLTVAVWAGACVALLGFDRIASASPLTLAGAIALGYAPRLLSVLTIAPFYGEARGRALDAWAMACVGWGVWTITGGPIATVLVCAGLGWLASVLICRLGGWVLGPASRAMRLSTAGTRNA